VSNIEAFSPRGMLHSSWEAQVYDYGISCGWALGGGLLLVGDASGNLFCFEGDSGNILWKKDNCHKEGLLAMSVNPDGKTFSTSGQDGMVKIWNCKNGEENFKVKLGKTWVEHLKWSPNGKSLAVGSSRNALIFNSNGEEIWNSGEHQSTVSAIAWANDNELATACYGRVTFYNVVSNNINQKLEWQGSLVSIALSPNGDIVACGSQDNSVHFWRRSTGQDAEMTGYPGKPSNLSFDNTGTLLATGGSERVTVWSFKGNGPEGTIPGELNHHTEPISCLSFANKGMLIASGSRDGSVVVSFLKENGDGNPVGAAFAGNIISAIEWKPNDSSIAAITSEGKINVWDFKVRQSNGFG